MATTLLMDSPPKTLQRLRSLEQLYEQGYQDEIIDRAVYKLFEHKIRQDEVQLAELAVDLDGYEKQFGISSQQFAAKYAIGEWGDDSEGFEWNVLYKMYMRLHYEITTLKAQQ